MTRAGARLHPCPGGCGAQVEFDRVACYPCWWLLPIGLRKAINVTFKTRVSNPAAWHQALNDGFRWYHNNPKAAA